MTAPRELTVVRPDASRATVTLHTADRASAPVLVLVPAMGMRAGWYAPFAAALRDAGFHVAVTELRGHEAAADARRPGRRHDFGYAELAADLGSAVQAVTAAVPSSPVVLLGHSMGGHVASAYLADAPDTVAGLVFVASGTTHWRAWGPRHLLRTQAALLLALVVGHFPGRRVGFAGREARGVLRDWARLARTGALTSGRPPRSHVAALQALELPVLAVTVEGDDLGPVRSVRGQLRWLPRARVETVHVTPAPGEATLDHFRWARRPELVVPALRAWLGRYVVAEQETSDRP
ncbi:alpha/beta hydrolase family protein [Jatrophihabitans sp. YIM 134969]